MRFKVTRASQLIVDGQTVDNVGYLVVDVERWWDAKTVAVLHFGCEPGELRYEPTSVDAQILTRWVGVDNGGSVPRHMQYSVPGGMWRPVEEYNDDRLAAEAARSVEVANEP